MDLAMTFISRTKAIFGCGWESEPPPENNILQPDLPIAPGPLPGGEAHASKPDFTVERSGRGSRAVNDELPGGGDNSAMPTASHSDQESSVDEAGNASESRNHCAAASNDNDRKLSGPSGQPQMSHSPSESLRFEDVKHSGISIGGGPVNVISFSGGIHRHNPSERIRPGLELLQMRVATSAFHNSAQRVDPPRCHPETRVAIQKQIYDWIMMDLLVRQTWIMWMHGAAGAGKSAIMQSVAELCELAQMPLASFFFVRTDATRNSMAPFIATLVYQLIQSIPHVREEILDIIESNPLIFDQSLKSQLDKLIIQPLLRIQKNFECYFVIMIDGLDECLERAHQADLIKLLGTISRSRTTPVIFLVASRREPQIEAAFARKEVSDLVLTLALDNSEVEQTSDDIRRFVVAKFRDIKETHLLKRHLPVDWPAASIVSQIIAKSSGQFIFASVVMSYLSSPRANPSTRLDIIRGIRLRNPSSQNPFAHLDALYQYIFSQVEELDKVLDIIGYVLSGGYHDLEHIERVFLLEIGEIDALFADLTAVILCEPVRRYGRIKFLHASLPDFLLDKSRSDQYYIDCVEYKTKLLCTFLERHPPTLDPLWSSDDIKHAMDQEESRFHAIMYLLEHKETSDRLLWASDRLSLACMNFNCRFSETFLDDRSYICIHTLRYLKALNFDDHGKAYRHVLGMFAEECTKYWHLVDEDIKHRIKLGCLDLYEACNLA